MNNKRRKEIGQPFHRDGKYREVPVKDILASFSVHVASNHLTSSNIVFKFFSKDIIHIIKSKRG